MKVLYITPKINNEGGVAKILSLKTNYLIEKWDYDIAIVTQNKGNDATFFPFNSKIEFFDISLNKKSASFLYQYKCQVSSCINQFKPDFIVITDNGLKGFLAALVIRAKVPIIFEIHGSKFNEESSFVKNFTNRFARKIKYEIKNFGVSKFDFVVALSAECAAEWNVKNCIIIPNGIPIKKSLFSNLDSKKAIAVVRNSYEKGLDRLLTVWKKISVLNPEWTLDIYGVNPDDLDLKKQLKFLEISNSIQLFSPVKNIEEKYLAASLYLMTSRNEGFPMVLLEAMSFSIPCIAYDCPVGPKALIQNGENGYLIPDGNEMLFVEKSTLLMNDGHLRKHLGNKAQQSVEKYNIDDVMLNWHRFFQSTLSH